MDTIVTISQFDSLNDVESKKELFNSLTYRERKISDTRQLELTGMNVNDFYNFMIDQYSDNSVEEPTIDDVLGESEIINRYNKTKINNTIIDKKIDYYQGELNKVRNLDKDNFKALPSIIKNKGDRNLSKQEYMYLLEDNIMYLKTLKELNKRENTTIDQVVIREVDTIVRLHIDKEDKIELIDSIIKDCENIIMAYDISISYMYGEDAKIEKGLKKISEISLSKLLSYLLGPIKMILDYIIKRCTNSIMIKVRTSIKSKDEMIKYRDKMENTLEAIKQKRKHLEE